VGTRGAPGGESLEVGISDRPDVEAGMGAGLEGCGKVAGLVTRGSEIDACTY